MGTSSPMTATSNNAAEGASGNPIKVLHLVSHPIQYFVPLYRALSQRSKIDLTVYYFSTVTLGAYADPGFGREIEWDTALAGGYRFEVAPGGATRPLESGFDPRINWPMLRRIAARKADVVWAHGYQSANTLLAAALGRARGVPLLLRDDQNLLTERPLLKRLAKRLTLPWLYSQVSALAVGTANEAYFRHYGTPPPRIFIAPHCVDNDFFSRRHKELLPARTSLRAKFGITDDHPVILFCGKLIAKKEPQVLLKAFADVRRDSPCHLLLVGDGPLRGHLAEIVRSQSIPDVHFAGFINQSGLPEAYTACDTLVLPSSHQETWGLVVNEAMNCHLPIIVSTHVGCGADLVVPGENGYRFPVGDVTELSSAIRQLVRTKAIRHAFGRRSAEIIRHFTIEACADKIVDACIAVTSRHR
jgi:glycosyltransferase involved in cell wall biosynthesis